MKSGFVFFKRVKDSCKFNLTNKIFKIFAGLAYAEKYNKEFVISKSITDNDGPEKHTQNLEKYIIKLFPKIRWIDSMPLHTVIKEPSELNNCVGNVVLDGYFQNEQYFPSSSLIPDIRTAYYPNTYFVHIRAGDYLPNNGIYDTVGWVKSTSIDTILSNAISESHKIINTGDDYDNSK